MPATIVVMPQLGESVVEGTVVRWIAKAGQRVQRDESLLEVATDKANTEIPSPSAGVLTEILAAEGAVVPVGGPLCSLDDAAQASAPQPGEPARTGPPASAGPASAGPASAGPPASAGHPAPAGQSAAPPARAAESGRAQGTRRGDGEVEASPVARNVAQEHGLDLGQVSGSGPGGRITKSDVLAHLEGRPDASLGPTSGVVNLQGSADNESPVPAGADLTGPSHPAGSAFAAEQRTQPPPPMPARTLPPPIAPTYGPGPVLLSLRAYKPPRYTPKEGDQVLPFDQRRRLIAEHMIYSKATSPHVPCTAEVDMTNLSRLREEWKKDKATGGKAPSFLVGLCRATIMALAEFPRLNAVVQDESLIVRRDVNLGVAVETEKGLLVPVIRKANERSVLGLARAIDDLAARGRSGKVTADELSGGSFTVSNPGLKGNLFGAAIINQPQVGILRMGEIVKRAVVRTMENQDAIVIRPMMYLTLSYDHRVIDGVTGNGFLHRVREIVEAARFPL